ncbi:MAG: hypothetical protein K6F96_04775 [Bacteroidales bacterium]|nr:hypothetical protein [Bacteroidales bacterium]
MKRLLTIVMMLLAVPVVAHNVVEHDGDYVITHEWMHNNQQWRCTLGVPVELYEYYQGRAHQSDRSVEYVLSDHDRHCIRDLVASFDGDMGNVISFVQSLRYVSDWDSKRCGEYVRFPVETLVDGCGDCEDLAILAAAILHEMGFGVLLVNLPDHMALAVACDNKDCDGTFYEFDGRKYYYLEVTSTGWAIGQVPDAYRSHRARLTPLLHRPHMRMPRCQYKHESYFSDQNKVPFAVEVEVENAGPGTTEGLALRALIISPDGRTLVDKSFPVDAIVEGKKVTYRIRFNVPRPIQGQMEVRVEGTNFDTVSLLFDDIELK